MKACTRLGPHEVLAPIGAGGMGEVYRARDTRLGRDVAIKVLPAEFAFGAVFCTMSYPANKPWSFERTREKEE
jgi:serine/threonine protein kinase